VSVRTSGRGTAELRPVQIEIGVSRHAEGSCLISVGETKVHCTASIEDRLPPFLHGRGEGWVTAEYGMLPRATAERVPRDRAGKGNGRTQEIQRLIGRSLRAVVDRKAFGDRTVWIDCDVLQADGGTRCASITGGFVALALALDRLSRDRKLAAYPLLDTVVAISTGVVAGEDLLDLDYDEDVNAEVDFNVVRTGGGRYIEVQGTAEKQPFARDRLNRLLDLADKGITELDRMARATLDERLRRLLRPRP
jgi:ribonuclease PH